MYKARFFWWQDTSYLIYKELLQPIVDNSKSLSSADIDIGNGSGGKVPINLDLDITEDFTYEIKSNFQNYGDVLSGLPFIGSLMGYMDTMNQAASLSGSSTNTSEWLKFQVWKETEPFKMSFKFVLSNYSDPFIDVYAPAMALSSMSILSPSVKGKSFEFNTPGVNSYSINGLDRTGGKGPTLPTNNVNQADKAIQEQINTSSKIIKEFIIWSPKVDGGTDYKAPTKYETTVDGVPLLKVKNCFIETAKPTWSKERTASGIPIWCELELTIQSIFSANDSMFSYLTKKSGYGGLEALGDTAKKVATNIFR